MSTSSIPTPNEIGRLTPPAPGGEAMAFKAGPKKTPPLHPGPIIAGALEDHEPKISVRTAAAAIGVTPAGLAKVLRGDGPVTPDMAALLGRYLGNGGRIWLDMQADYDLHQSEKKLIARLAKIKPLSK